LAVRAQLAATDQAIDWDRVLRVVAWAAFAIAAARAVLYYLDLDNPAASVGVDLNLYLGAARRWLAGGEFYAAFQLAGPYHVIGAGEILYPPVILPLLLPFLVLPGILWWLTPLALTVVAIARMRPAAWSLAAIGLLCTTHAVQAPFFWGTPVIWLLPIVAWGVLLGWPAAFVLVKPTLAPFAIVGMTKPRSFFVGVVLLALLGVLFLPLWIQWVTVIRNSDLGPLYAYTQIALLVIPVIAWLGRDGHSPSAVTWIERRIATRG
jgi:hypothetical protein